MPDASPTKWHLAHTTWFFETFVLRPHAPATAPFDPAYEYLFNSYYEAVGPRHPRPQRGMITRPGVAEILAYRRHVVGRDGGAARREPGHRTPLVELGLHHEQQHQELILMDAKHLLSLNPLKPAYRAGGACADVASRVGVARLRRRAGRDRPRRRGFAFDNEGPRHRVWLEPFALAVAAGQLRRVSRVHRGRRLPAAGVLAVGRLGLRQPARLAGAALLGAGRRRAGSVFTLSGLQPLDPAAPVCHVSGFEAAAFAKWAGKRLPREAEWEAGAAALRGHGHRLGMDRQPLRRLSRLSRAAGRDRRIQRQVHGQPDGAARRLLGDAAPAICARLIATSSRPTPAGCSAAFASRRISDERLALASRPRRDWMTASEFRDAVLAGLDGARRAPFRPSSSTTRAARRCSMRSASCLSIT